MARTGLSDPIADFIALLDARLHGPPAAKADLLDEARDGLHDAAEAHAAAGHPDPRRQAVAEFGDPGRIARAYQAELGAAEGTRTLKSVLLAVPLLHALWQVNMLVWIGEWSDFGPTPPSWYLVVADTQDTIGWVVMGLAAVALLAVRSLSRRGTDTRRLGRAAGFLSAIGTTLMALTLITLLVSTAAFDPSRLLMPVPCLSVGLAMFVVHGRLLVLAHRSLKFSAA
ncbi:permease prefix domain 1-containing protein [Actinokineospora soli]|uniref:Permease prefix domain 1-containing protein n=1 Tax=Actinokineospora soli TaxID=1048753 RepID=A0ABW2TIJ7_9PSEU